MTDVWQLCQGEQARGLLECGAWRIVEDQYRAATRKLVDSIEEQSVLEAMLDATKPRLSPTLRHYHYLLSTPFRYPPLRYGSRFGTRYEPSLWYGSYDIETAMAERAYYRLSFLHASEADYRPLPVKYSVFKVDIKSEAGVDLTVYPFITYCHLISSPGSYQVSQQLGQQMRAAGIEAFCYVSARCPRRGKNVGLFVPEAFKSKSPSEPFQSWLCIATKQYVEFFRTSSLHPESKQFTLDVFLVDGLLPQPQ